MALTVENGRLYCTTAEVEFGPEFKDDDEACDFVRYILDTRGLDPREHSKLDKPLEEILAEMRNCSEVINS